MHRNITAIYRTHDVADLVRREIADLGISRSHIHVVPEGADTVSTGSYRDESTYREGLDHLGLPDSDRHTYEQAVRRGDHVVSVRVDDETHLDRIAEIMRRPEAYDFDTVDEEFRTVPPAERTAPTAAAPMGARDTRDYGSRGVRAYTYDEPYRPAM